MSKPAPISIKRYLLILFAGIITSGCAVHTHSSCAAPVILPANIEHLFEETNDDKLLHTALGQPGKGRLCNGKVYTLKPGKSLTIYRAWNSANARSRFSSWWALSRPEGSITQYRYVFEICYQWSPLDKMTQCELKPGSKIVIGTGQSAECPELISYPTSDKLQLYIKNTAESVYNCNDYDAHFKWLPSRK